jgi:cytoskeleton protein RodZ
MRNAQAPLWPELTEKSDMGSFGERMQREREMRSITLDEIAQHTKISKRNLSALEEENFAQLPGGIFNKGFVRAYAKYLGIDEEQAVSDYLAAETEKLRKKMPIPIDQANGTGPRPDLVLMERMAAAKEAEPQADQAAGFMKAGIALVVLLGIGGLGYKWMQSRNAVAPPVEAQTETAKSAPVTPTAQVPSVATTTQLETKSAEGISAPVVPVELRSPITSAPIAAFKLALKTNEESWVQVKADGKVLMEGVLAPNSNKSFDASKELVIKLGNASGVELAYNGKPLPQFENVERGKTKTLTFTAQGLAESVR